MPFPVSPNPGDSYTDAYGTVWIYAGSVNGWYRQTVIPGNETSYTADLITTDKIIDNTIINADVASNAAIAGTKINPNFGSQNVTTTGTSTAASFIPTSSTAPTNGLYLPSANSVALSTNSLPRLMVTSTGRATGFTTTDNCLLLASSAAAGTTFAFIYGSHTATAINTGTICFAVFTNGNVQNTNNSYSAYSDVKLKENIVNASSQWDDLKALRVVNYNFKPETGAETHRQLGLIAQEVEMVSPGLVSESPDRDAEGNDLGTVTKSVNYSVLYMKAVKALQEAMERIETLEAAVTALQQS